jgi:hypothetical protein
MEPSTTKGSIMRGIIYVSLYMAGYLLVLLAGLVVFWNLSRDDAPGAAAVFSLLGLAVASVVAAEVQFKGSDSSG